MFARNCLRDKGKNIICYKIVCNKEILQKCWILIYDKIETGLLKLKINPLPFIRNETESPNRMKRQHFMKGLKKISILQNL